MEETEIDIRGILDLLRRRVRMIALTALAVVGVAILALVAITPIYTATSLIFVDPSRKNLLEADQTAVATSADSARVDSEVEILRSNSVLLSVVRDEGLIDDPEFGVSVGVLGRIRAFFQLGSSEPEADPLQQVLAKFSDAVSVQRRGLTYLIAVSVDSKSPERAAELANALAGAYIDGQLASKVSSITASQQIIEARIGQTSQALVATEQAFDDFITVNIERLSEQEGFTDIEQLRDQLTELTERRQSLSSVAESVERSLASEDWSGLVAALQSEAVDALNQQRLALSQQLAETGANSSAAIDLRAELQAIEDRLTAQAQQEAMALTASLPQLQTQADTLRQQLRTTVMDSNLPVDVLARLYELQQSAELVRAQYQTLLARNSELQVQADLQIADSRVVAPALSPRNPSFPNRRLVLILAGLMGLGLGIGLAFLYENYVGGFTSEGQVGSVLKTPVLAEIPRQKDFDHAKNLSLADIMVETPLSIYAEAIRRIRSGIDQAARRAGVLQPKEGERRGLTIMVSSTSPGEGKSTLSLSLARAYSASGQRTILIDCDMRKPSIHKQLGFAQAVGLVDILRTETQSPEEALKRDPLSDTNLILGARSADIPTDQLILSKGFARLINACRKGFDVVIIDTPPVGPVVDATHIAQFADVILFVTRWSATGQSEARAAVSRLEAAADHNPPILAVLNQQEGYSARYYNRKYAGYYAQT